LTARYGLEIRSAQASDAPFLAEFLAGAGHAIPALELARRLEALRVDSGVALLAGRGGRMIGARRARPIQFGVGGGRGEFRPPR
jgi:hypothetical protein